MHTLAENKPEAVTSLRENGYPSIAEMLARFRSATEMGNAIGMSAGAVSHWLNNAGFPGKPAERSAQLWLKANPVSAEAQATLPGITAPAQAAQKPAESGTVLMVVVDPAQVAKVQRVLAVIGCEVIEV